MVITYKTCEIDDLALLIDVAKRTFITAFKEQNNKDDFETYIASAFSEKQIKSELLNPNCMFYLAYLNDALIGYFKLNEKEAQHEQFEEEGIELERIYILEEFQKQRLGEQLLYKSLEIANTKKVAFLWLGVWEHNMSAIRFYKKHGFSKFSTHPYYLGKDKQTDWLLKRSFN
jgi:ribosomal protein S18 acetylase RimI-like enzyme